MATCAPLSNYCRFIVRARKNTLPQFRRKTLALLVTSGFLLEPTLVLAQEAPGAGALQRELELQLNRSAPPSSPALPEPRRPREVTKDQQTIDVKAFQFRGNTLVPTEALQAITEAWTNRPVDFGQLNDVTAVIQDYYVKQGRLAQATIPPQEVKNGIVIIDITEAKLGKVIVEPEDANDPPRFNTERARGFIKSDDDGHLYIDTYQLERGTMLLNEVPGIRAQGSFEQGSSEGTTNYKVALGKTPLLSGEVAASNYGFLGTGNIQGVVNLGVNNVTGNGDRASVDAIFSQGSSFAQGGYLIPVGNDGFYLGAQGSYFYYKTLSSWTTPAQQSEGWSWTAQVSGTYALLRSQAANSNIKLSLDSRNYVNVNTMTLNTISDYKLNSANLGLNGNWAPFNTGVFNYGVNLVAGNLTINDLTQQGADLTGPGTAGGYGKLGYNFSYLQQLDEMGATSWSNSIYGQFANKNLNSAEQIYLGGPFAVRSYSVAQGGGSTGAIFSSEISHKLFQGFAASVFGDFGVVQQYINLKQTTIPNPVNNSYTVGDLGFGLKYNWGSLSANGSLAWHMGNNPYASVPNSNAAYRSPQGWFRLSWAL